MRLCRDGKYRASGVAIPHQHFKYRVEFLIDNVNMRGTVEMSLWFIDVFAVPLMLMLSKMGLFRCKS